MCRPVPGEQHRGLTYDIASDTSQFKDYFSNIPIPEALRTRKYINCKTYETTSTAPNPTTIARIGYAADSP